MTSHQAIRDTSHKSVYWPETGTFVCLPSAYRLVALSFVCQLTANVDPIGAIYVACGGVPLADGGASVGEHLARKAFAAKVKGSCLWAACTFHFHLNQHLAFISAQSLSLNGAIPPSDRPWSAEIWLTLRRNKQKQIEIALIGSRLWGCVGAFKLNCK